MWNVLLWAPEKTLVGLGASVGVEEIIARLGQRAFVIGGARALVAAESFVTSLRNSQHAIDVRTFRGECTDRAIGRMAEDAKGCDVIIGIGGGKALDTAKATASLLDLACVTVPTSPATCAAYTPLSIVHEEGGQYAESRRLPQPVTLAVIDPALMASAPPHLLAAGMVDALARYTDASLASRGARLSVGAAASLAISQACIDHAIAPFGTTALNASSGNEVGIEFQRVVDACILGAGLAGETGARFFGRGFSHAVGYALADIPCSAGILHGEAVGLGIVTQSAIDPDAEGDLSLPCLLQRLAGWHVPTRFSDVGIDLTKPGIAHRLAERTLAYLDTERAVPFSVTSVQLERAFFAVEEATPPDIC